MNSTGEIKLLNYIRQNAEMGVDGIDMIYDNVKNQKFKDVLLSQKDEYNSYYSKADSLLRRKNGEPEEISPIAKISTSVSGKMKNMMERSDSDYAEDMMKGTSMGVSKLIKHLHEYDGKESDEAFILAKELADCEEKNIEAIKSFL